MGIYPLKISLVASNEAFPFFQALKKGRFWGVNSHSRLVSGNVIQTSRPQTPLSPLDDLFPVGKKKCLQNSGKKNGYQHFYLVPLMKTTTLRKRPNNQKKQTSMAFLAGSSTRSSSRQPQKKGKKNPPKTNFSKTAITEVHGFQQQVTGLPVDSTAADRWFPGGKKKQLDKWWGKMEGLRTQLPAPFFQKHHGGWFWSFSPSWNQDLSHMAGGECRVLSSTCSWMDGMDGISMDSLPCRWIFGDLSIIPWFSMWSFGLLSCWRAFESQNYQNLTRKYGCFQK